MQATIHFAEQASMYKFSYNIIIIIVMAYTRTLHTL